MSGAVALQNEPKIPMAGGSVAHKGSRVPMAGALASPKRAAVRVTPRSVYNTNPNSRERGHRFARRTRNPDGGLALQNEPEAGITARVILIKRTWGPDGGLFGFPQNELRCA